MSNNITPDILTEAYCSLSKVEWLGDLAGYLDKLEKINDVKLIMVWGNSRSTLGLDRATIGIYKGWATALAAESATRADFWTLLKVYNYKGLIYERR